MVILGAPSLVHKNAVCYVVGHRIRYIEICDYVEYTKSGMVGMLGTQVFVITQQTSH